MYVHIALVWAIYCMSKKSLPILYNKFLYKMGQGPRLLVYTVCCISRYVLWNLRTSQYSCKTSKFQIQFFVGIPGSFSGSGLFSRIRIIASLSSFLRWCRCPCTGRTGPWSRQTSAACGSSSSETPGTVCQFSLDQIYKPFKHEGFKFILAQKMVDVFYDIVF